jgi:RNA polymerase-interacting CarD/CdnL/TRCF family regulator
MSKNRIKINRKRTSKSDKDFFTQLEENNEDAKSDNSRNENRNKYTRQTFIISLDHAEKLRDFVHTKKLREDYNYTQKQALENALELLFNTVDKIEKRDEAGQ